MWFSFLLSLKDLSFSQINSGIRKAQCTNLNLGRPIGVFSVIEYPSFESSWALEPAFTENLRKDIVDESVSILFCYSAETKSWRFSKQNRAWIFLLLKYGASLWKILILFGCADMHSRNSLFKQLFRNLGFQILYICFLTFKYENNYTIKIDISFLFKLFFVPTEFVSRLIALENSRLVLFVS